MRLTLQTDHALRILMALGQAEGRTVSVDELARKFAVSKNHLMKTSHALITAGFVTSVRGRSGGLKLAWPADRINVGTVVRRMEDTGGFVDCSEPSGKGCIVTPVCGLRHVLANSIEAYMEYLDQYMVDDLIADPAAFKSAFAEI